MALKFGSGGRRFRLVAHKLPQSLRPRSICRQSDRVGPGRHESGKHSDRLGAAAAIFSFRGATPEGSVHLATECVTVSCVLAGKLPLWNQAAISAFIVVEPSQPRSLVPACIRYGHRGCPEPLSHGERVGVTERFWIQNYRIPVLGTVSRHKDSCSWQTNCNR